MHIKHMIVGLVLGSSGVFIAAPSINEAAYAQGREPGAGIDARDAAREAREAREAKELREAREARSAARERIGHHRFEARVQRQRFRKARDEGRDRDAQRAITERDYHDDAARAAEREAREAEASIDRIESRSRAANN